MKPQPGSPHIPPPHIPPHDILPSHIPPSLDPSAERSNLGGTIPVDELAAHCFGCGPANPQGLHLHFDLDTTDPEHPIATALVHLTELHQGPPGHIHGGIVATLCDEAMSKLNRPLDVLAMTRHLTVDYLRPAPLHTPLTLIARNDRRDGRKLFHHAELQLPNGEVLARGNGLFIVIDPRHLAAARPSTSTP